MEVRHHLLVVGQTDTRMFRRVIAHPGRVMILTTLGTSRFVRRVLRCPRPKHLGMGLTLRGLRLVTSLSMFRTGGGQDKKYGISLIASGLIRLTLRFPTQRRLLVQLRLPHPIPWLTRRRTPAKPLQQGAQRRNSFRTMTHLGRTPFRLLAWLGAFTNAAHGYVSLFAISPDAEKALAWMYYGALLPERLLPPIWSLVWMSFIVGFFLFALGFSWSRWLLLALLGLTQVLNPLSGIYVATAAEVFFSHLAMWLIWAPFVLSFFEPCSTYLSPIGPFGSPKDRTPGSNSEP